MTKRRHPIPLPPILALPGLRLIEIGTDRGRTYFKFAVEDDDVREVTIYMIAAEPIEWTYQYAMYDRETNTVIEYKGKHGDPAKDRRIKITGA